MRYSVWKAEDRLDDEELCEDLARRMAVNKGYDITEFLATDHKNMWRETFDRMMEHWYNQIGKRPPWERSPE